MKPYALAILLLIFVVLIVLIFASEPVSTCQEDLYNCNNFTSQEAAQEVFDLCDEDVHHLDSNNDGIACESLTTTQ
ncbi:hypothetical protein HN592_04395 [Candidatus Woesearchaeota archaeon]|jgi:hypothetical protein|nr:hypothetical protein [Candidatus Woesearchaeota archaeon]MBT4368453.1 hypothetical protein [Candidatus Woesearchaeota archaeon]MBT4712942.1 hypothetical protein [Candidatus Woesearchaeota archaeon]MBT6639854.1 hypothetical protein [Candidatus Woesearchaeota archaeon]MBT7134026.1 hypothetical protein [Candidatus Woesearchaeota archaeon]